MRLEWVSFVPRMPHTDAIPNTGATHAAPDSIPHAKSNSLTNSLTNAVPDAPPNTPPDSVPNTAANAETALPWGRCERFGLGK